MRVDFGQEVYEFQFRYFWMKNDRKVPDPPTMKQIGSKDLWLQALVKWRREHREATQCIIWQVVEGKLVYLLSARVVRCWKDSQHPVIGREAALEKAIAALCRTSCVVYEGDSAADTTARIEGVRLAFLREYFVRCKPSDSFHERFLQDAVGASAGAMQMLEALEAPRSL